MYLVISNSEEAALNHFKTCVGEDKINNIAITNMTIIREFRGSH